MKKCTFKDKICCAIFSAFSQILCFISLAPGYLFIHPPCNTFLYIILTKNHHPMCLPKRCNEINFGGFLLLDYMQKTTKLCKDTGEETGKLQRTPLTRKNNQSHSYSKATQFQ